MGKDDDDGVPGSADGGRPDQDETEDDDDAGVGLGQRHVQRPLLQLCDAGHEQMEQRMALKGAEARGESLRSAAETRSPPPSVSKLQKSKSGLSSSAGDGEAISVASSLCEAQRQALLNTTPDKLKGMDLVQYWVLKLPLSGIIRGEKPGVALHQAELALRRLEGKHQTLLKAHMAAVEWSKTLSCHGLPSASQSEVWEAIKGLSDLNVQWPTHLQQTMWMQEMARITQQLATNFSEAALSAFMWHLRPYRLESDGECDAKIDFKRPRLLQVSISVETKAALLLEWCLEEALVPLILEAEVRQKDTLAFCSFILQDSLGSHMFLCPATNWGEGQP